MATRARIERRDRQREFWQRRYNEDPAFFGPEESEFARWCLPILMSEAGLREIVELGCGYGRDARYLSARGFHVRAVDLVRRTGPSPDVARAEIDTIESDCLEFLSNLAGGSVDAVYSNMFLNMDFTEREHRDLVRAVHRALAPRGLHLFSVRSTSDPWYGRGRRVRPDTYDPAPRGVTMHFFSEAYADRLSKGRFEPVRREERCVGGAVFPIRLWYFAVRRFG